jgi:hypothetical protein
MKRAFTYLSLLLVPLYSFAGVSGSIEKEFFGDTLQITVSDGYAFTAPDTFDETKEVTFVILSEKPFSKDGLDKERDREDVIRDRLRSLDAAYIELNISHEYNTLQSVNFYAPGRGNLSTSGNTLGKLTHFDGERVAGSLSDSDVEFDLPIAPPPKLPEAVALPPDGGEPGAAYRAHQAAIAEGDVDTLAKYMKPDMAAQMLAERDSPDFAENLKFLQEMNADETRITGGEQFGDDLAVIKIEGGSEAEKFTGEVTMKKGPEGWYVEKESRSY